MTFHKSRNETSHTYNADVADNIFEVAGKFLPAASDSFSEITEG